MHIPTPDYLRIQEVLPILCVDCVITHEQRGLLLRRRNHPARGQLWFPGGRLFKNELIATAATRKALEEVGLECEFQSILSIEETRFPRVDDMLTDAHTVNVCCHLTVSGMTEIMLDHQHEGFYWIDKDEAQELPLHEGVRRPLLLSLGAS